MNKNLRLPEQLLMQGNSVIYPEATPSVFKQKRINKDVAETLTNLITMVKLDGFYGTISQNVKVSLKGVIGNKTIFFEVSGNLFEKWLEDYGMLNGYLTENIMVGFDRTTAEYIPVGSPQHTWYMQEAVDRQATESLESEKEKRKAELAEFNRFAKEQTANVLKQLKVGQKVELLDIFWGEEKTEAIYLGEHFYGYGRFNQKQGEIQFYSKKEHVFLISRGKYLSQRSNKYRVVGFKRLSLLSEPKQYFGKSSKKDIVALNILDEHVGSEIEQIMPEFKNVKDGNEYNFRTVFNIMEFEKNQYKVSPLSRAVSREFAEYAKIISFSKTKKEAIEKFKQAYAQLESKTRVFEQEFI